MGVFDERYNSGFGAKQNQGYEWQLQVKNAENKLNKSSSFF